jgi:uncharacterized damage-inducible protein DinB
MLTTIRELIDHKGYANAALLTAIGANPEARHDPEIWETLHHILVSNRFWLLAVTGRPFVLDVEERLSPSFDSLVNRYREMQAEESAWAKSASETALDRLLDSPLIPGQRCSVAQAWLQVCLHSLGHRAQCAKMLRRLGVTPPMTDFILWIASRPTAAWPSAGTGNHPGL